MMPKHKDKALIRDLFESIIPVLEHSNTITMRGHSYSTPPPPCPVVC